MKNLCCFYLSNYNLYGFNQNSKNIFRLISETAENYLKCLVKIEEKNR